MGEEEGDASLLREEEEEAMKWGPKWRFKRVKFGPELDRLLEQGWEAIDVGFASDIVTVQRKRKR